MNNTYKTRTPRMPDHSPLEFAPDGEQGVVYLFSAIARSKYGLHVERVQQGYPDCIAYQDGKLVRIEFEYRSRNFAQHRHPAKNCDWVVCWIHDWPKAPKHLHIIELRKDFGMGFNVWFQPLGGKDWKDLLAKTTYNDCWSVPPQASEGDLLLFYFTSPESYVKHLFRVAGPVGYVKAGWKKGKDWMAAIRRVATLKAPLHLEQMRQHRILRDAGFVRGSMMGRPRATAYWSQLHEMILDQNPALRTALAKYGPGRLA